MTILITILDFFLGIFSSFIASVLFIFFLLTFFGPSIKISSSIAKQKNTFESTPEFMYIFKFYNNSFHHAFDADLTLFKVETNNNNKGEKFIGLTVKAPSMKQIPKFRKVKDASELAPHCLLFRTIEDLEKICNDDNAVELQITLKHGLTGLSRAFKQRFVKADIKNGQFQYGNNLGVN